MENWTLELYVSYYFTLNSFPFFFFFKSLHWQVKKWITASSITLSATTGLNNGQGDDEGTQACKAGEKEKERKREGHKRRLEKKHRNRMERKGLKADKLENREVSWVTSGDGAIVSFYLRNRSLASASLKCFCLCKLLMKRSMPEKNGSNISERVGCAFISYCFQLVYPDAWGPEASQYRLFTQMFWTWVDYRADLDSHWSPHLVIGEESCFIAE